MRVMDNEAMTIGILLRQTQKTSQSVICRTPQIRGTDFHRNSFQSENIFAHFLLALESPISTYERKQECTIHLKELTWHNCPNFDLSACVRPPLKENTSWHICEATNILKSSHPTSIVCQTLSNAMAPRSLSPGHSGLFRHCVNKWDKVWRDLQLALRVLEMAFNNRCLHVPAPRCAQLRERSSKTVPTFLFDRPRLRDDSLLVRLKLSRWRNWLW